MNTQVLLDTLIRAVSFKYKEDKTCPGVTISRLKNGYYCSVVRYEAAFAKGKSVVCSAKADTLDSALQNLAATFLSSVKVQPDPLQELNTLVRGV